MTGDYWALGWGEKAWTNAPADVVNGSGAEPVTLRHYARVARELGVDDWTTAQPGRSPTVLATWIAVLGVDDGLWDDLSAAETELAATPLSTLAACLVALSGEG